MMLRLRTDEMLLVSLRIHLRHSRTEEVAFLLGTPDDSDSSCMRLRLTELYCVPAEEFEIQSAWHVSLRDEVRPKMIKWAWNADAVLIEAHSHKTRKAAMFSPSDLAGLSDFVPHVRWRLRGKPYVALVFAADTFDALVWQGDSSQADALEGLQVSDGSPERPTGLTLRALSQGLTHDWR